MGEEKNIIWDHLLFNFCKVLNSNKTNEGVSVNVNVIETLRNSSDIEM